MKFKWDKSRYHFVLKYTSIPKPSRVSITPAISLISIFPDPSASYNRKVKINLSSSDLRVTRSIAWNGLDTLRFFSTIGL